MVKTRHDRYVAAPDLAVGLAKVICHRGQMFSPQMDRDCSQELGQELPSVYGQ